jgi:hypothetical protein
VRGGLIKYGPPATADLTARFAVPEHPFDPASWQHRGRDFLKQATANLDDLSVPELLSRLGIAKLLAEHGVGVSRGHATVNLMLGAAATEARLAIDVNEVTGGPLVGSISSHIAIGVGVQGTHLRVETIGHDVHDPGHDVGLGALDADVPMTIDRWLSDPAAVLRAPITADWTLPRTQIKPVFEIAGRHDLIGGMVEGSATIRGTLGTPIIQSARLLGHDLAVTPRLGGHPLPVLRDLDIAATWDGASGTVEITGHETTGGELHAGANGRPDELAGVTGWLTANRLDIAPLAAVLPLPRVPIAGVVDAKLRLRAGSHIAGDLDVTNGVLPISASLGTLRDATTHLWIREDGAIAGTLKGKLGGGTVDLDADIATDGTTIVQTLQLDHVSVPTAFHPVINADLTAELHLEGMQLRGKATVRQAHITLPEHVGPALLDASVPPDLEFTLPGAVAAPGAQAAGAQSSRAQAEGQTPGPQVSRAQAPGTQAPGAQAPEAQASKSRPWLDVELTLLPTQIDAPNVVDSVGLGIHANLHSSNTLQVSIGNTVGVHGNIVVDNADVDFLGRRYDLDESKQSQLKFEGTTDPELDIHMTHQFPTLTMTVGLRGPASKWQKPDLSSDPASYSYDRLFGFLLGGEPGGDPNSQTREAVKGAAALAISGKLGREINKVLPIKVDALSCEPATTATSASCTVGKWLSQRLFLSYRQHLEALRDENANDVQFQYRVGRKVLIEGTGGDRGHYGADLLWRHRW